MVVKKHTGLDTDNTLGGTGAADDIIPSQKAVKEYVDNKGGGSSEASHNLFDLKWSDHILNDISWLRADTFSWQSGTVYTDAYNHLKDEFDACVADPDYATKYERTETIGDYTITYCLCPDGHKIVTDYWETTVANIYAATGVAWYYILDTTNQRFKLPRTKYGFTGLRDTVGKYVPESLPNITGKIDARSNSGAASGAFIRGTSISNSYAGTGGTAESVYSIDFDASRSSSAYQNNAPVQQRSTQMYLYFYVGQFSQSATEQTAGITTEALNNKIDIDLGNATTTTKKTVVGWSMPSNMYIEVSHSNGTYTAPANGYFQMSVNINDRQRYAYCGIDASGIYSKEWGNEYTTDDFRFFIPVKKGDVINYGLSGGSWNYARFIYAQGEI